MRIQSPQFRNILKLYFVPFNTKHQFVGPRDCINEKLYYFILKIIFHEINKFQVFLEVGVVL